MSMIGSVQSRCHEGSPVICMSVYLSPRPTKLYDLLQVKTKMFHGVSSTARYILEVQRSEVKVKDVNIFTINFQ